MRIGSLNRTSLLDYPGKLSAIVGTQGCNMRCPWCHNFYLIPYEFTGHSEPVEEEGFFNFLDQRKHFLDGVVITGGEPTIQADLPQFCENVKKMGFSVKLDTNGTHPSVLNCLLENELVDYIAMDIKTDLGQYHQLLKKNIDLNEILKSVEMILSSDQPYEFRITCVSPFVTKDNMDEMGRLMKGAKSLFLQKCNQTNRLDQASEYEIIDGDRLVELKQIADPYVLNCEIR